MPVTRALTPCSLTSRACARKSERALPPSKWVRCEIKAMESGELGAAQARGSRGATPRGTGAAGGPGFYSAPLVPGPWLAAISGRSRPCAGRPGRDDRHRRTACRHRSWACRHRGRGDRHAAGSHGHRGAGTHAAGSRRGSGSRDPHAAGSHAARRAARSPGLHPAGRSRGPDGAGSPARHGPGSRDLHHAAQSRGQGLGRRACRRHGEAGHRHSPPRRGGSSCCRSPGGRHRSGRGRRGRSPGRPGVAGRCAAPGSWAPGRRSARPGWSAS
mmetsp:Transcript_1230/g.3416  ORF Transcript_1230/g.3416 Transcript_1230/m.3416 type:complete len:272 (+) Transcript_1230:347-1162(+)